MKYRLQVDMDEVMCADSAFELVEKLWTSSMNPVPSKTAYRVRAAMWARELYQVSIRTYNDQVFVDDMISAGVWKPVELNA